MASALGATSHYTVPAGYLAVVRQFDCINIGGGTAVIELNITSIGYIFVAQSSSYLDYHQWKGRAVVNEGEQLNAFQSSGAWGYQCSGYLLTLP